MSTLDRFVEEDYSLVYFHYGLTGKNKPPLSWLWQAYKQFDRKYKKNLKALYLVHPTNFIRVVWQLFKAVIRWVLHILLPENYSVLYAQFFDGNMSYKHQKYEVQSHIIFILFVCLFMIITFGICDNIVPRQQYV